ncbi:MAG: hypothetical protein ACRDRY_22005 [Pseudonocardiaceae bacterium]
MLNKAENGATVGRAKLGYRNVRIKVNGHDVNTIEVDADRSPYIVMAFELAATGKFSNVDDIRAKITDAGLRMPSGKPEMPIWPCWLNGNKALSRGFNYAVERFERLR